MSREMTSKQRIRREIDARRKALDSGTVNDASAGIVRSIQTLKAFQSAKTVALYMAITGEVDLDALFPICWKNGIRTCTPVFNPSARMYEMAEISSKTRFEEGHYGIREPLSPIPCPMEQVDFIAVPGVAFDRNGHRLGRGGGYYDRLLDGFSGRTAAAAFDFQLLPAIPVEPHDLPVELIVTETQVIKVSNEH